MASGEAFNAALGLGAAQAVATDRQTNVASKPPVPGDHPDGAIEYAPPARSPKKPPRSALYKADPRRQRPARTGVGRPKKYGKSILPVMPLVVLDCGRAAPG